MLNPPCTGPSFTVECPSLTYAQLNLRLIFKQPAFSGHSSVQRIPLPYQDDSSSIFEHLVDLAYPVFLDSGLSSIQRGRYDILSASPDYRIVADASGAKTLNASGNVIDQDTCGFNLLEQWLLKTGFNGNSGNEGDIPFNGGALGYLGYDLGRALETIPNKAVDDIELPWMQMGIYSWAIIVDHRDKQTQLVYSDLTKTTEFHTLAEAIKHQNKASLIGEHDQSLFQLKSTFSSNINLTNYFIKFNQIIDYINKGDCYQVNLAQRFSAAYTGSTWHAYQALRTAAPMPFSAYLGLGDSAILSLSPERFISVSKGVVETRPIKGTRPRGASPEADTTLINDLVDSVKDRAENLMIVDLLRNDIGKTCITGSVHVEQLFTVESYANVHHLVSVIKGKLATPEEAVSLLKGAFPGGSITGAPKIRAMEIIEELEPHRRSAYCGAIGYIANNGNMDTNISIRTIVADNQQLHCWAGGGIVADSQAKHEYQETFDKVSNLTSCLEDAFLKHN